jgi:N-acetylmuramoyl-L-alanine amidase
MTKLPQFDKDYWRAQIQQPDWYLKLVPDLKAATTKIDDTTKEKYLRGVRRFFESELLVGNVALAQAGPNLDKTRQPIDTIVIHHTSWRPGYRLSFMEAVQLLNIYAPYYMNPHLRQERGLKGGPLWSNHFKDGRQTFLCYHWLMRMNGSFERLLPDSAIGWHAGNWQINRRSVAICLDNDYETKNPRAVLLKQLAAHIKDNYPQVKPERVIGHCECRPGTVCPGGNFIAAWKAQLINYLIG